LEHSVSFLFQDPIDVSLEFNETLTFNDYSGMLQADVSSVQLSLQESMPLVNPCDEQVSPPRLAPSHVSPASIMLLPQTGSV
jgi:hypothetical protein